MGDAMLAAAAPLLAEAFTLWGSPVTWVEIVAFVLAVWMVVCNWRVNPLAWPLAMLSSLGYALLFAQYRLYGEAALQFVFIAVALWGWWQWLRGRGDDGGALRVHRLTPRGRWVALAAAAVLWPLIALALQRFTNSDIAWLDALPTAGSLVAQGLLGRKLVENWPAWVAVNVVSVGLFAVKGLWLTVLLYALFTVMAGVGWRSWQRMVVDGARR
ncbi:MAG: nicotinamide mononucleotide transporter [Burkholderiaceae bacterium]|nr:nicotinamide mononucleotide transporter [Burkholderiaceae bacterium]